MSEDTPALQPSAPTHPNLKTLPQSKPQRCWESDHTIRPTFEDILDQLQRLRSRLRPPDGASGHTGHTGHTGSGGIPGSPGVGGLHAAAGGPAGARLPGGSQEGLLLHRTLSQLDESVEGTVTTTSGGGGGGGEGGEGGEGGGDRTARSRVSHCCLGKDDACKVLFLIAFTAAARQNLAVSREASPTPTPTTPTHHPPPAVRPEPQEPRGRQRAHRRVQELQELLHQPARQL
jgi:hypothetical protein